MNRILFLTLSGVLLCLQVTFSQAQIKTIKGIVTDGLVPLKNVNIIVKESENGVKTDAEGRYEIQVDEGQTLEYSYVGKSTIEIVIEDVTEFLNIEMFDKIEELEGVTVTKKKRKSQKELLFEYNTNENLIKSSFGLLDKERVGYRMRMIDGEQLRNSGADFVDGLQTLVPGIQVYRPGTLRPGGGSLARRNRRPTDLTIPMVFLPRTLQSMMNPVPAIFDVDGIIYTDAPTFINASNIKRIAIIESLAGVGRYGTLGVGGVIVINTKSGNFTPREPGTQKPFDQAKLRNNFFDEELIQTTKLPSYLGELKASKEINQAEMTFRRLEKKYSGSPYFYLDAFSFFNGTLKDSQLSNEIKSVIKNRYATDPTILKALSYMLEESGDFQEAIEMNKEVFILRPHYAQSYFNLAKSYQYADKAENAATLFARYNYLVQESFFEESEVFTPLMKREFNNLLTLNGSLFSDKKSIVKVEDDDFNGTRLVFEWNNGEAEFELQFVNPNMQYYTWKHSLQENPKRIRDEKKHGFSCEEYLIYDNAGTWNVNIKYLGNKSLTPTYLKVTAYHNYNTKAQKRTIKIFRLGERNLNQQLLSVNSTKFIAIN
ncbi:MULTISPECIES: carboxypeptidase-like regulatory domain-containing protein [Flavobacteriaceae]|uniref:carboxypeptidase-like regulatory domain-containing protein n=1 Tax=Flavobacteriaceae TaxID=49546 RepID=UPI00149198DC|nr:MULTISPECIES: carboxypeptidase-like regulatory domain-containing protein [Allomuricauda]MDC6364498.1 carboxypeptidase-like regulatory domain-containing protein [Muricauda sp. AC10]